MCLVYRERTEGGHNILHGRNGREYWLPAPPSFSVDGFCSETWVVYECYFHGRTCQPFRYFITMNEDTLGERYESRWRG